MVLEKSCRFIVPVQTVEGSYPDIAKPVFCHRAYSVGGKSVGGIDLIKGELKGYGLMQIVHQCLTGDPADFYFAFKNTNTNYSLGDKGLFEKLYDKTTPKDALQVLVNCYKEAYPEFVEFTAWDGSEQKLPWLEWAEMQFTCAYMPRSMKDTMSLEKLLKHFKVDY